MKVDKLVYKDILYEYMTEFIESQDKLEPELSEAEKWTELEALYNCITQPFLHDDDMPSGWKKVFMLLSETMYIHDAGSYKVEEFTPGNVYARSRIPGTEPGTHNIDIVMINGNDRTINSIVTQFGVENSSGEYRTVNPAKTDTRYALEIEKAFERKLPIPRKQ